MKLSTRFREVDRDKFEAVRDGIKTIETRAATARYAKLKVGDVIVATCGKDKVEKEIIEAKHFNSIEEMFEVYEMRSILPGVTALGEAQKIYYSFPGYKEKIQEHGIIALVLSRN
jgi:ASC-1-like (ASCH) protein